jgi:hypothetical protein
MVSNMLPKNMALFPKGAWFQSKTNKIDGTWMTVFDRH